MVSNIMLFETVGYASKKLRNKAVFVSLKYCMHCYVVLSNRDVPIIGSAVISVNDMGHLVISVIGMRYMLNRYLFNVINACALVVSF